MADDEIDPELLDLISPEAVAALRQLKAQKQASLANVVDSGDFVSEDFGKSQFWYDDATSSALADEAVAEANALAADGCGAIACVSSPSVFRALVAKHVPNRIVLFEYDRRFEALYGAQFSFYDVHHPRAVDKPYVHAFDFIVADPPYLNTDVVRKTGETIDVLRRTPDAHCIYNTGAILEEAIFQVLGLRKLTWQPRHSSHLSNTFYSFANYASARLGGFDKPIEAVVDAVKELNLLTPAAAQVEAKEKE